MSQVAAPNSLGSSDAKVSKKFGNGSTTAMRKPLGDLQNSIKDENVKPGFKVFRDPPKPTKPVNSKVSLRNQEVQTDVSDIGSLRSLEGKITELTEENKELKQELEAYKSVLETNNEMLNNTMDAYGELEKEKEALEARLDAVAEVLVETNQEKESLSEKVESLEKTIKEAKNDSDSSSLSH